MSTAESILDSVQAAPEDVSERAESDVCGNPEGMLEYETKLFFDIVQKDGIVIAAKGVCLLNVVSNILRVYADAGNLVLVVNCTAHEERQLAARLRAARVDASLLHTTATHSSGTTDDRHDLYLGGGVHFVTTRILVLDLLKHRVPIARITGIVALNAHRVLESGQEAFVMRLYRQSNKTGFVKAFSNDAQSFTYGFGQLERIMRNLFVREVHIWPRFHSSLVASLQAHTPPDLIELRIPITAGMERIQTCLLELINNLIKEIKAANKTVELTELTVENALLPKFVRLLSTQLDGIWERLSHSSRQLTSELRVLHQLLVRHLFHSDAVALHAHVQQYRSKAYVSSATWPYYREADQLFTAIRERVLSDANELDPEYCPKWKPLFDILSTEIPTDLANTKSTDPTTVLILCQDRRICHQLNQFLRYGPRHYLLMQTLQNGVKFGKMSDRFKSYKTTILGEENNVVLAGDTNKDTQSIRRSVRKQLEQTEEGRGEDGEEGEEEEELKNVYHLTMNESLKSTSIVNDESVHEDSQYVFEPAAAVPEACGAISLVIRTFREAVSGDGAATLFEALETLRPSYVVLYQANVTAIRQLEIHEARKTDRDVRTKIFFLVHVGTVEEQSYLTSLRREKQAFEYLIQTKSRMVVPEDQDGRSSDIVPEPVEGAPGSTSQSSRTGGACASNSASADCTIIVDMREFRSELPALLHRRGIRIEPLTITVGDYILTPSICVERKSLSDLVGSLQSGRLYAQCTAMQRTYSRPMLLIEFDQNKPFSWECMHYMISTDEPNATFDVQKRLVLLTMHFPKLRIIWSPNPYATAALFHELKEGKDEPVATHVQAAQQLADPEQAHSSHCKYHAALSDVLPRLPGVTSRTAVQLMAAFADLADLCGATELQLRDALATGSSDAKALYAALHGDTATAAATAARPKKAGGPTNKFAYSKKSKSN